MKEQSQRQQVFRFYSGGGEREQRVQVCIRTSTRPSVSLRKLVSGAESPKKKKRKMKRKSVCQLDSFLVSSSTLVKNWIPTAERLYTVVRHCSCSCCWCQQEMRPRYLASHWSLSPPCHYRVALRLEEDDSERAKQFETVFSQGCKLQKNVVPQGLVWPLVLQ